MLRVAIDGPGGTGKSTIAKAVASLFGIEYIDTGAMYRSIALKTLRLNIDTTDEAAIQLMLQDTTIDFASNHTYLDGEDVSDIIRTNDVSMQASKVSKYPCVRAKVDALSTQIAKTKDVVMEGRDICTFVIPDAEVKIFMTASAEIRANRRYKQLKDSGKVISYETVLNEINERDYQDSHRDYHPLMQAEDAIFLDSSNLTLEESIEAVAKIITDVSGVVPQMSDIVEV